MASPSGSRGTRPQSAPATSERVASYLREAILAGEFKPGDRIRQEDVAARLGASRIPVRDALRILQAEGLTQHETNKGARVPLLDARDVDLLYQMRERLEPLALTESMPRLTAADLDGLRVIQERIEESTDVATFLVLDRQFHLLSYSRCAMDPLSETVHRLWNSTQHYRRVFMTLIGQGRRWIVNAEHTLLLEAIGRQDAVAAAGFLKGHIRRTRVELAEHPEIFVP